MLALRSLCCRAGDFSLRDLDLDLGVGEYLALVGPTGSGKTTLIKCIAGLIQASSGTILLGARNITDLDPSERNIGFLPQDYCLFPHLDVRGNILFGLAVRRTLREEAGVRLSRLAEVLRIHELLARPTGTLSGGEAQRVALARALIVHPQAILLDEPFSAVDPGMRMRLWFEIKEILRALSITVIHVTHNLDEASAVGDRIGVLIDGALEQLGTRDEVLLRPATERVARYEGIRNIYRGEIIGLEGGTVTVQCGPLRIEAPREERHRLNQAVTVCVRPQDIKIIKAGYPLRDELRDNLFEGAITSAYFCNDFCSMTVRSCVEFELRFPSYIYRRHNLHAGKRITVGIRRSAIVVFPMARDTAPQLIVPRM
jgi:ABC-type Fe3+/spermidine/putrescine transport system ATPase subunit